VRRHFENCHRETRRKPPSSSHRGVLSQSFFIIIVIIFNDYCRRFFLFAHLLLSNLPNNQLMTIMREKGTTVSNFPAHRPHDSAKEGGRTADFYWQKAEM
jgi:hypothetical protein